MSVSLSPSATSWIELRRANPEAQRSVQEEVRELARALAVESLASDPDADLDDIDQRHAHLQEAAWPSSEDAGLEDFRLESSLGAFVVTRIALAWVPSGQTGLRRSPHDAHSLLRALLAQGVDPVTAQLVVGESLPCPEDFQPKREGLRIGTLAGLAERSLTPEEHRAALAQVAYSPRDVARLGACLTLTRAARRLLAFLPSPECGTRFAACLALLATDRPSRVLELLPEAPTGLRERTARELAEAWVAWANGASWRTLDADEWTPGLRDILATVDETRTEPETPPGDDVSWDDAVDAMHDQLEAGESLIDPLLTNDLAPSPDDTSIDDPETGEDEVLEILEERVDPDAATAAEGPAPSRWLDKAGPLPAGWRSPSGPPRSISLPPAMMSARGAVLGLVPLRDDERGGPLPPDFRVLEASPDLSSSHMNTSLEGNEAEAFLPVTRWALGLLASVAQGRPIAAHAAERSGGMAWLVARAGAVADLAEGRLEAAERRLLGFSVEEAPELSWIHSRRTRFQGREAEALTEVERRAAVVPLVADLARALARTLTVPSPPEVETET